MTGDDRQRLATRRAGRTTRGSTAGWRFPAAGKVTIFTGKVEIGQGVLTAMLQIAAEELDVAPDRIAIHSGDTDATPNEGFTAGSQSMQFGGVALRQACAEVRALFLARGGATRSAAHAAELSMQRRRRPAQRQADRPRTIGRWRTPVTLSIERDR